MTTISMYFKSSSVKSRSTTMKTTIIFILFVLVVSATGAPKPGADERIYGGTPATEGEFPYIVSITDTTGQHICGGFIYNNDWIVTAASCVNGLTPSQLTLIFGQLSVINLEPNELSIPAFAIVIHGDYNTTNKMNDIALIELSTPVYLNGLPYDLITYDEVEDTIPTTLFMGWGATTNGGLPSTRLRKGELQLKTTAECRSSNYTVAEFDPNYMVCAGSSTIGPCTFDEGSPLVQGGIAIGVYSKNKGCGNTQAPSIFTRLSVYYAWLISNAGLQVRITTTTPIPTAPCQSCVSTPASG